MVTLASENYNINYKMSYFIHILLFIMQLIL